MGYTQKLTQLKIDKNRRRPAGGGGAKVVAVLVLLAAAGAGAYYYRRQAGAPVEVKTARATIETPGTAREEGAGLFTANGYVIPRDPVEVSSKIVGRVREIHVDRGFRLKQGDLILEIDDEEYLAQVKVAEARVGTLRAQLAELEAGSRLQEIDAFRARVEASKATLARAEADFARFEKLLAENIVSVAEFDVMRQAVDVARADLESAEKNYDLVKVGPRRERIDAARAQLREAEANLELARTQLEYTRIHAPIDGVVLEKVARKGELVTNTNFGGTRGAKSSVISMADLSDLQVETDINEERIADVFMGQKCEVRLESHPDRVFAGEVDDISPQADRQKATVEVKVKMLDPDESVRPEVSARVSFLPKAEPAPVAEAEADAPPPAPAVWIPREALVRGGEGPSVFVVSKDKVLLRKVVTGTEGEAKVEIRDGLVGTESVVLSPPATLSGGDRVLVK